MIRGSLCLSLIILSLYLAIPTSLQYGIGHSPEVNHALPLNPYFQDPNGTLAAFNITYGNFDLYTYNSNTVASSFRNSSGTFPGIPSKNVTLALLSRFNNTKDGSQIGNTAFQYFINNNTSVAQNITWALNIPKGVASSTYLKFDWNGTLGSGTRASYQLFNGTGTSAKIIPGFNSTKTGQSTISGGPPLNQTGGVPVTCGRTDECIDVSKFIGFSITLAFSFNSTATGKRLNIQVTNIEVASIQTSLVQSCPSASICTYSHFMFFNTTNPGQVVHNIDLNIAYNANVTYHKPNTTNMNVTHTWGQMVTTFYLPKSYQLSYIAFNMTSNQISLLHPIAQGLCPQSFCTQSVFISLNMTTIAAHKTVALIKATGVNAETSLQTTLGGVPTNFWVPGDIPQVRINDAQGVNATGFNIVSILSPPSGPAFNQTQTFSAPARGIFLFNFTGVLPQSPLGKNWNVTSVFRNGYDLGIAFSTFQVDRIQVNQGSFAYSGDNKRLTVHGALSYGSNSTTKPTNVNGSIFAVDSGVGPAPLSTPTISGGTSKGVYVSNVTLVNGVFTSGESLFMTFTLVNPPSNGPVDVNATIDHEWINGQTHGASVTVPLTLGDQPFTLSPSNSYVYRLNATLTAGGIRLVVTSLARGNSVTVNIPAGIPPVTSVRQHSGLFKITVTSTTHCALSPCGSPTSTNSLESPTYAYVLANPPVPGRLLASAPFTTISDGTFTTSITSGGELGARKLVFFALGRDPNGIVITVQDKSTPESTLLQTSIDNIPTATEGQSVTVTLHLTSNSTVVNMNITVSLDIDGKGVVRSQSGVYIPHGATKDVTFSFNAPSGLGVHSLTFFSPEYGAPLIAGTLQVSALQSSLQVIIPAIIGLAAAIVILLFFLFRKKPEVVPEPSAKDKPVGGKVSKPSPGSSSSKSLT